MLIKDWLEAFMQGHRERHGGEWPEPFSPDGKQLYSAWLRVMIDARATQPELAQVSREIKSEPGWGPSDHLAALLAGLQVMREKVTPQDADVSKRAVAMDNANGCEHCSGTGLAQVYNPDPKRWPNIPTQVAAHCLCTAGRWMRAQSTADIIRRTPDFVNVWAGKSGWIPYNPATPDDPEPADFRPSKWRDLLAERTKA